MNTEYKEKLIPQDTKFEDLDFNDEFIEDKILVAIITLQLCCQNLFSAPYITSWIHLQW